MKKNSLIKYLSLMGLTLASTSCEKQEKQSFEENENYPSPLQKSLAQKIGYTPLVELHLPDSVNNQIIALATLVQDVFDDHSVAQRFSQNPKEYLESKGLMNCNIDLNSVEVKTNENDVPVVNELIEQNVYKIVKTIENMDIYKQNTNINREHLIILIRKQLTQNFIDTGQI